jgi:hypothetical protein
MFSVLDSSNNNQMMASGQKGQALVKAPSFEPENRQRRLPFQIYLRHVRKFFATVTGEASLPRRIANFALSGLPNGDTPKKSPDICCATVPAIRAPATSFV